MPVSVLKRETDRPRLGWTKTTTASYSQSSKYRLAELDNRDRHSNRKPDTTEYSKTV